jgi:hypothetical protein
MENLDKKIDDIHQLLLLLNINMELTNEKIDTLEKKVDHLTTKIDGDLMKECKKMGSHIDFIETVYDNVKHPLGYICAKVQYLTGNEETQYALTEE